MLPFEMALKLRFGAEGPSSCFPVQRVILQCTMLYSEAVRCAETHSMLLTVDAF